MEVSIMSFYGKWETWKVVYYLPPAQCNGFSNKGVAFVEAGDHHHASQVFREQYAGQFYTIDTIERLLG
jgi:hypothetical protein